MPLTFEDAFNYLSTFINYERQPLASYTRETFDLEEFDRFLTRLGRPHELLKTVVIAGTKGKGSTAAMIASVAQASGLKAGLYTSPHLCSIRERIRVNGALITEEDFASLVEELQPHLEAAGMAGVRRFRTFFETLTAMALLHFRRLGVDLAVLEVGLGGRLDATNVATPLVSVITSISFDHVEVLGDTIPKIAREKAGIIKPHGLTVVAPQRPEALAVIRDVCTARDARLVEVARELRWQPRHYGWEGSVVDLESTRRTYPKLEVPLAGPHQLLNAATAIATAEQLEAQGLPISAEGIRQGMKRVQWEGRLETVSRQPWIVLDGAHNRDSARCLREALATCFPYQRLILVLGISANKNLGGIIEELTPLAAVTVATRAMVPRAASPQLVADLAAKWCSRIVAEEDTQTALAQAIAETRQDDLLLVTGSLYLVGDAKRLLPGLLNPMVATASARVQG
ncbi:MAG TPA: folylpolyglutamate synthase/dihydrofolate synthase family protein [Candidatus Tectomicrobia bacterium]|nr:folylpolyglutamate synthase/dihydrofolate synthase family protein [Candidatus Tectomicrobia bacterium]